MKTCKEILDEILNVEPNIVYELISNITANLEEVGN